MHIWDSTCIKAIEKELIVEIKNEEKYWKQKARINWLKSGDKNTSFFHTKNIYTSCNPRYFHCITAGFTPRVSEEMNASLISPFTFKEVTKAIFSINPSKAPGEDGLFAVFFQKYWNLIGRDIFQGVMEFFNSGRMLKNANHTVISLIPKVKSVKTMKDLRPIGLCNVFYKIIAKLLTLRLQPLMDSIVGSEQNGFIKGRLILDNILICHEIMHSLKIKKHSKSAGMAIKLDMSKAYECVEWSFLQHMLYCFGFHEKWISWIMQCVSSVTFSLQFNGHRFGYLTPTRGIRQGDPLSPYLFLLVAEGFSHALNNLAIRGLSASRHGPSISHLLFADDYILFTQATMEQANIIQSILHNYSRASGQSVNLAKSTIIFSPNTSLILKQQICSSLNIHNLEVNDRFLGLPAHFYRSKTQTFGYLRERIEKTCAGWKEKLLSKCGKEVLIKAVPSAIPVYTMSCFRLLTALYDKINSIMSNFWWGQQQNERKIYWVAWSKLSTQGNRGSWGWRSVLWEREILNQGIRWHVGNGENIFCKEDVWVPLLFPGKPHLKEGHDTYITRVVQLINPSSKLWDATILSRNFEPADVEKIRAITLSIFAREDWLVWNFEKSGVYSVMSSYWKAKDLSRRAAMEPNGNPSPSSSSHNSCFWKSLWKTNVPSKLRIFLWLFCLVRLPFWFNSPLQLRSSYLSSSTMMDKWTKKDRNAFTFNHISKPAEESVSLAIRSRDDFREATSNHPLPSHQSEMDQQLLIHQSQLSWQPTPLGFIKLNFNAAWDKNSNSGATAVIVRDLSGSVIDWWVSISDPLQLESIACREALLFAKSRGFSRFIIGAT
ncbi:uncharacterized protein LOC122723980 [Manihot esculenta]|uniref:uncharacterized protein LOC122723980 n=1 Tax=Manihot esculenta TaxID=3983 RepID=UPI001CC77397|nr:uncharacterized protein LOC122723980 [Manihot esculenta]